MLEANGFHSPTWEQNVPASRFVDEAEASGADGIAISALLTTTMSGQRRWWKSWRSGRCARASRCWWEALLAARSGLNKSARTATLATPVAAVALARRLIGAG